MVKKRRKKKKERKIKKEAEDIKKIQRGYAFL